MSTITTCKGCGAPFQTENREKPGYVLSMEHPFCQACFRLMHYGESHDHFHPEDLPELPKDALIIMMSSVLHLDCLFHYPVYRYQPEATFLYIINQIDLLPKQTNTEHLLKSIMDRAKSLKVPLVDAILMSSRNPFDLEHFKTYLNTFAHQHVYLIGVQNSGKTTLFKALTENSNALSYKKAALTQSPLLGRYQNKTVVDLPGLYQKGYLHEFLAYSVYKNLIPDHEIKPKIYPLKMNQTVWIEGLFIITLLSSDRSLVFYLDSNVRLHRTQKDALPKLFAGDFFQNTIHATPMETRVFALPLGKQQLTLADMGFVHVEGPAKLSITAPKNIHMTVTEALFK